MVRVKDKTGCHSCDLCGQPSQCLVQPRVCLTSEWTPKLAWFLEPYKIFKTNSCSLEKLRPILGLSAHSCGELPPKELPEGPPGQELCHSGHLRASLDQVTGFWGKGWSAHTGFLSVCSAGGGNCPPICKSLLFVVVTRPLTGLRVL